MGSRNRGLFSLNFSFNFCNFNNDLLIVLLAIIGSRKRCFGEKDNIVAIGAINMNLTVINYDAICQWT